MKELQPTHRFTIWAIETDGSKKRVAYSNNEDLARSIVEKNDPNLFVVGQPQPLEVFSHERTLARNK